MQEWLQLKEQLHAIDGLVVREDESMSRHTSFRIGGNADHYVVPDVKQLEKILRAVRSCPVPLTVIGNGSNLLVGDDGIRGLTVEIGKGMAGISVEGDSVVAEAGALLARVAKAAAGAGLSGFEFAAGIPGSVGGAVVMNAGAYGGEMKDVLQSVTVLTRDGELLELPAEALQLSYRHSCIPQEGYVVVQARLKLFPSDRQQVLAKMAELKEKRVSKQPLEFPSAGSTFKRPEGYFAGKLIEDAGLKGFRVGDAQVSEKHCGFVINRGAATAAEVRMLIDEVTGRVKERFGVELEPEVRMVGVFTKEG